MGFFTTLIIGLIAGWIASTINKVDLGLVGNLAIGVFGAFAGSLIFMAFGGEGTTGFNLYSLLVAAVGATILLWLITGLVRSRKNFR